jgi:ribosomal protein S12 methylthiotransferase
VRFLYCYPTGISDDLLRVMAEREGICKYFDIPLQHASRDVLGRMRRGGSRDSYERLIDRIREGVPGVAVRTTFIVGFPGEREEDFEELLGFVRAVEFDNVGVFTYSDEEHSAACELDEKVDPATAKRRERRLMKEQSRISMRKNRARVGQRIRVLLEGRSKQSDLLLEGRSESQAPEIDGSVLINDMPEGSELRPGDFVTVEITEAMQYDLVGRIVQETGVGGQGIRKSESFFFPRPPIPGP